MVLYLYFFALSPTTHTRCRREGKGLFLCGSVRLPQEMKRRGEEGGLPVFQPRSGFHLRLYGFLEEREEVEPRLPLYLINRHHVG